MRKTKRKVNEWQWRNDVASSSGYIAGNSTIQLRNGTNRCSDMSAMIVRIRPSFCYLFCIGCWISRKNSLRSFQWTSQLSANYWYRHSLNADRHVKSVILRTLASIVHVELRTVVKHHPLVAIIIGSALGRTGCWEGFKSTEPGIDESWKVP